jgi:hypothetical protein
MSARPYALLILVLALAWPCSKALAAGEWINDEEGCYCGTYPSGAVPVAFISKGTGSQDERQATQDQMNYWNKYAQIYAPSLGTGIGSLSNPANEIHTFISAEQITTIYGLTAQEGLYGAAIIDPGNHFGGFDDCEEFYTNSVGCNDFSQTDVVINADFSGGWTTDPNDYTHALVQTTALHELGHTWGAHHVFTLTDFGDSFSAMNYMNDDSGRFVTRMDAKTIRAAYPTAVQTVTDVGIFPFVFGNQYYGETYATVSHSTVDAGSTINVSNWLIQNIGTNTAHSTVVSFYFSSDTTITSNDILLGTADFGNLAVDAEGDQNTTLTIPDTVTEGIYYIGAIVTVGGSEDSISINNRFIIGRPARTRVTVGTGGCLIADSGFEGGKPNALWVERSTNYSSPLCDTTCGSGGGTGPYSGNWWAWFGGADGTVEEGVLEQVVTIDSSASYLNFYLEIPLAETTGYLRVMLDGNTLMEISEADSASYGTYRGVSLDISSYADDQSHTLRLESRTEAGTGPLNFFVDDLCFSATAVGSTSGGGGGDSGGGGCFLGSIGS